MSSKQSLKRFVPGKGTLAALLLASMMNVMGGAAVAPVLPAISAAFPGSSESLIALIITLPSLAVAVSGFFVGAVADRFGKAKTLVVSLIMFTISGLSGLFLPSIETILVGRFLLGISISGISASTSALITEYYDQSQRPRIFGMQNAASGVSIVTMETGGGFLALLGWRVPFYVYAIGIVLVVFAVLFVREPQHETDQRSADTDLPAKNAAQLPAVPKSRVRFVAIVSLSGMFVLFCTNFLVPSKMPYLIESFGGNTVLSGIFLGVFGTANTVSALTYAPLERRFGRRIVIPAGYLVQCSGLAIMGSVSSVWGILPGAILSGLGIGTLMPLFANWLSTVTTPKNSGKYMGVLNMSVNLAQFISAFISSSLVLALGSYSALFVIGAIPGTIIAIACIVYGAMRKRLRRKAS